MIFFRNTTPSRHLVWIPVIGFFLCMNNSPSRGQFYKDGRIHTLILLYQVLCICVTGIGIGFYIINVVKH